MKKGILILTGFMALSLASTSYCAENIKSKDKEKVPLTTKPQAVPTNLPTIKTNILYGEIVSIDFSNSTIIIKDISTGEKNTINFTPTTGVTKLTDVNELKQGDNIRVIYQDQEGKKTARAIMFGKIRLKTISEKPSPSSTKTSASQESEKKQ